MPNDRKGEPSWLGLQRVKLLEGLERQALEQLARQCRWLRFAREETIISRDAPADSVYLIIAGRVRVIAFSAAGRQVSFGEMREGECFGDFAAIDGLSRSADIRALEATTVAAMSPAIFRRLLNDHEGVRDRMFKRLVACVRDLTERVYEFSTLGVQNRLHAELLRLARQSGVKDNTAQIDPAPRHADIAAQISTYREQVSRELAELAKQGLVEKSGRALVVPDVARLERVVAEVRRSS